jgi:hypothetical protein
MEGVVKREPMMPASSQTAIETTIPTAFFMSFSRGAMRIVSKGKRDVN